MVNILSATLPPSKSFPKPAARGYHWCPALPGQLHLGTLTVTQGKRDADSYHVDEDTSEYIPGRRFLLSKLDAAADVYAVTVGNRGPVCTCDGFHFKKTCKHIDAVKA